VVVAEKDSVLPVRRVAMYGKSVEMICKIEAGYRQTNGILWVDFEISHQPRIGGKEIRKA
jgi:hypothetical protein